MASEPTNTINTMESIIKVFNLDDFSDVKKYLYAVSYDCLKKSYANGTYYLYNNDNTNSITFITETLYLLDIYNSYESKKYKDSLFDNLKKIKDLAVLKTKTSAYKAKYKRYLLSINEDIKNFEVDNTLKPKFKEEPIINKEIEFVSLGNEGE